MLAPELIPIFYETQLKKKLPKTKYREKGGDVLTLIVPKDFHLITKNETKSNQKAKEGKGLKKLGIKVQEN